MSVKNYLIFKLQLNNIGQKQPKKETLFIKE